MNYEDEYLDMLDEANEMFDIDTKVFIEFDRENKRDKKKKNKNKQIKVNNENKEF